MTSTNILTTNSLLLPLHGLFHDHERDVENDSEAQNSAGDSEKRSVGVRPGDDDVHPEQTREHAAEVESGCEERELELEGHQLVSVVVQVQLGQFNLVLN